MASVVMADDGIAFDGVMAERAPLGGAETAFVALAEALAARGHQVEARNRCRAAVARLAICLRPLHRQSQPPGHRARAPRRASRAVAAQSRLLSEKAAQSVAARLVPPDPGGERHLSYGDDPAMAALRRTRDYPLWRSRSLSHRPTSRAPAAAGDLHVEPVARARLAARSLGRAHQARGAGG